MKSLFKEKEFYWVPMVELQSAKVEYSTLQRHFLREKEISIFQRLTLFTISSLIV